MPKKTYKEEIERVRERYDTLFVKSPNSPLIPEQKADFKGLSYYPIDERYRLIVELIEYQNQYEVTILSTKGNQRKYVRFGYIEFELDDQTNILTIYKPLQGDYLFLPFKDKTTGTETYQGGRYVEIEKAPKGKYEVDFNKAYNPLCAYNDLSDCAGVPNENILQISMLAGAKKYSDYRKTR